MLLRKESLLTNLKIIQNQYWSCGNSVSVLTAYRLEDRAKGIRSPVEANYTFFGLSVQTSSKAHPASYPTGAGGKARSGPLPSNTEVKNE